MIGWGQTVSYTAFTTVTCPATPTATISPAVSGLTFTQMSRGAGVTCGVAGGAISGSGFNGTLAANIAASRWYTFDVTSDASVSFNVTSLSIVSRVSSAAGTPSVSVQYSIGGGAKTVIGTFTPTGTAATYTLPTSISVGASQTLNIFVIPNTLTAAGTTCRIENNTSITLTTTPVCSNVSISSHPVNQSIGVGNNTTFSVTASNVASYQWQEDTGGGFTNLSNGGVYSNVTTSTMNITGATLAMNGYQYRCVMTASGSCTGATSNTATLNVSGSAPEIDIQGNSISITSGDFTPSTIDHTDFGTVNTVSGSIVRTFTIQNNGASILNISGVSISGANAADYSITSSPSSIVAAGGSTAFDVTFDPSVDGLKSATITIVNDDSDESNYTFAIQGTGLSAPVITSSLTASGTQNIAFSYSTVATNSPTSYGATGLPAGLSINLGTGAITGTPTVSGTFNVSISATNAAGTDTQMLVITLAAGPCLNDGFSGGTTPPSGWTFTAIGGTYATAGNFGASSPALQMDATGDSITTATVTNASELSFWIKGNGTNSASALLVQGFNGVSWVTIDNITNSIPVAGTTKTYNASTTPALIDGFIQFRFVYTKGTGNLAFDDVKVSCVTVWNGSAWSNGTPTLASVAVINGNYDTTSHGDIQAYNLTINPTFTTTVTSNHYATIQNNLTVNGTLNIQNNGSLVQVNDSGVNTGNINMERTAIADRLDMCIGLLQ